MELKQKKGREYVSIITFYNEVFVPTARRLLEELAPTDNAQNHKQLSEDSNNNDGEHTLKLFLKVSALRIKSTLCFFFFFYF